LLLNGGAVYRQLFCHLWEGYKRLVAQKRKQASAILAAEIDALPVVGQRIALNVVAVKVVIVRTTKLSGVRTTF
jgi:hypothetical protein